VYSHHDFSNLTYKLIIGAMNNLLQKTLTLLLVLTCTSMSFSQENEKTKSKREIAKAEKEIEQANDDFDTYAYIDAREVYLKVVEDGYPSSQVYRNLGDTYYWNSDYKNAAKWYQKLVNEYPGEAKTIYYYRAAQSLKSLKQYDESDRLMNLFSDLGGDSLIVRNFKDNPKYLDSIAFNAKGYNLEKVSINTKSSDFGPSYFGERLVFASEAADSIVDGVRIYEWTGQPYLDLYIADMDEDGRLFNAGAMAGDINTPYHESSTTFTKDGTTVYFTRNNYIEGKAGKDKDKTIRLKLYKATISGDNFWTNIVELPFNGKENSKDDPEFSTAHPTLSKDEKRLYFSSDRPGTMGMSDIWYVDIEGDNQYSRPINLGPGINTGARESFPFISEENNLYFSSDGRAGLGGYDIFVTPLDAKGRSTTITNLGEPANSNQDDFGFIIREKKQIGYLTSNRDGGRGSIDDDIYRVKEKCQITIVGTVFDIDTEALLEGAEVIMHDSNDLVVDSTTVGADGAYSFMADCDTSYTITGTKEKYTSVKKEFTTPKTSQELVVPLPMGQTCPPNDLGCRLSLQPIYFDFDKYYIRSPDAENEIAKILAAMITYPQLIIHIESHTDSRALDKYNEWLSGKRAESTLEWLVAKGIKRGRLSSKGYGEYQLVNQCSDGVDCSEEEHQLNRRSMFIIQN